MKMFDFRGYKVMIQNENNPANAMLMINDKHVPLIYKVSLGWHVHHVMFGWFEELDLLAKHLIVATPELNFNPHGAHGNENHQNNSNNDPLLVVIFDRQSQTNLIEKRIYTRGSDIGSFGEYNINLYIQEAKNKGENIINGKGILFVNRYFDNQKNIISTTYDYDSTIDSFQDLKTLTAFAINGKKPEVFIRHRINSNNTTRILEDYKVNGNTIHEENDLIPIETALTLTEKTKLTNPLTGGEIDIMVGYTYTNRGGFKVSFINDEARLSGDNLEKAKNAAEIYGFLLANNPGLNIEVEGHTSTPEPPIIDYNLKLSKARADSVKDLIVREAKKIESNFNRNRVTAVGRGATELIVNPDVGLGSPEKNEEAQLRNRRIEILFQDISER